MLICLLRYKLSSINIMHQTLLFVVISLGAIVGNTGKIILKFKGVREKSVRYKKDNFISSFWLLLAEDFSDCKQSTDQAVALLTLHGIDLTSCGEETGTTCVSVEQIYCDTLGCLIILKKNCSCSSITIVAGMVSITYSFSLYLTCINIIRK